MLLNQSKLLKNSKKSSFSLCLDIFQGKIIFSFRFSFFSHAPIINLNSAKISLEHFPNRQFFSIKKISISIFKFSAENLKFSKKLRFFEISRNFLKFFEKSEVQFIYFQTVTFSDFFFLIPFAERILRTIFQNFHAVEIFFRKSQSWSKK